MKGLRIQSMVAAMLLLAIGSQLGYLAADGDLGGGGGSDAENAPQGDSGESAATSAEGGEVENADSGDSDVEEAEAQASGDYEPPPVSDNADVGESATL